MRAPRAAGFSLLEMAISTMVLVGILAIVLPVSGVVGRNLSMNRCQGELRERVQIASSRVAGFLRPASLGTLRVNVAGAWVIPAEATPYDSIQFRALTGYPYGSTPDLGPLRVLRFKLDVGEIANGVDDDRDGLIDEGGLYVEEGGKPVELAEGVELFRVIKIGRTLVFTIQCGGRDSDGGMQRTRFEQTIVLRNN